MLKIYWTKKEQINSDSKKYFDKTFSGHVPQRTPPPHNSLEGSQQVNFLFSATVDFISVPGDINIENINYCWTITYAEIDMDRNI